MKIKYLFFVFFCSIFSFSAQEKVNWLSFENAIELNKKNPKPILISIYTDWCGFCKKMEKETYENPKIASFINAHFYAIKLNGEGKENIKYKGYTFRYQKYGTTGFHELVATFLDRKLIYPTTIFLSKEEEFLQKISGYKSKEVIEKKLAFFYKDAYDKITWEEFEKNFKSNLKP